MARLGDRLDAVATFNEPWCIVWLSHLYGIHAPGERNMQAALHAMHHMNLAHGLGVEAIRSEAPNVPVGLVSMPRSIIPGSDSPADLAAGERAHQFHNGAFFDPVFKGEYPKEFLEALGDRMPVIEDGDLKIISQKLDWWGLNYYKPERVADDAERKGDFPWTVEAPPASDVKTDIGWEIYAPGLKLSVEISTAATSCRIATSPRTAPATTWMSIDGEVDDQPRLDYYRRPSRSRRRPDQGRLSR